jgi:hypothetical protein
LFLELDDEADKEEDEEAIKNDFGAGDGLHVVGVGDVETTLDFDLVLGGSVFVGKGVVVDGR